MRCRYLSVQACCLHRGEARKHRRDLVLFQKVDQPHEHGLDFQLIAFADERRYRVHDKNLWLELVDHLMQHGEMHLQTIE